MKHFLRQMTVLATAAMLSLTVNAQQLSNANFEDWSGAAFDGNEQPKGWNASNVEQFGFKFNFAHKESGHSGYCMMVQDQSVGAAGITETSPGYFSLGQPWAYVPGLTSVNQATAGTSGGINFTYRPDSMSVWIRRTGNNTDKEDFYLIIYGWEQQAKGSAYKGKNGSCTSHEETNEESDVRRALNGNECKTVTEGKQVYEGMWREKKTYGSWTNIIVPIYYLNDNAPKLMNIIFSASNYPNFRANSGLYEGNSLYVDDVELIYSATIQKLYVNGEVWNGFDPSSTAVQEYALGEDATQIPTLKAVRGAGTITNAKGNTVPFPGRTLTGSEITVKNGDLTTTPTTITVKSDDGKKTMTYKIQFKKAASSNAKLAGIQVNGTAISGFSATKTAYAVELPYGTTEAPVVTVDKQEEKQTVAITQATSPTGSATIVVTAANGKDKMTYTLNFSIGKLADNTLAGIKINGKDIPGFSPSQTIYKVSQPVGTSSITVEAVSKYPAGEQTIAITPSPLPTGEAINGATVQIAVTTPGNATPKTYKLNFKLEASSYTYLSDILLDGVSIENFEPENLTYYVNLPLGTTALPAITTVAGDEYQGTPDISLLGEGVLDGTVRIVVTAGNGDKATYKLVFSTAKSEISSLADIKVGGVSLEGFDPTKTSYTYQLPIGTTALPDIEPVKGDEYENVQITYGAVNGTTRITVTAGNGNTTIYLITFAVDAYTDNTLKMIYVGGIEIANFDPETNEYDIKLEKGTTSLPAVTFDKQDEDLQTVNTRSGGVNGDYKITVRPQSGASRTYIIHFSVDASSNNKLADLKVGGTTIEGFHADTLNYKYILPEGESTIPTVTYTKSEESQRVLSVLEDTTQTITVTAESGEKRIYTIDFRIQLSANAFLKMIYLDGAPIATPFDSSQTNYTIPLEGSTCPAISVDKYPGQQVTVTSPIGAGTAVILVAPEAGATNTYKITFEPVASATVQLKKILVNGSLIDGWAPTTMHYTASYEKNLPTVTYEAEEGQTVQLMWVAEKAFLHVTDTLGTTASYDITFSRAFNKNTALASIKADGVELDGWAATKKHYAFDLAAGSEYPELSYEKADEAQTVAFGQVAEGKWNFLVTADNGDTTTYTVQYTIAEYALVAPAHIALHGKGVSGFTYDPEQTIYSGFELDEGDDLPDLEVTANPQQKILCANLSDTQQAVYVTAEDGTQTVYTINYIRKKSSDAKLAGILIDGVSLEGFDPNTTDYIDSLAWRTKVVPNIFPVYGNKNQTIVTEFCRPNGTAKITVYAQDFADYPEHKSEYTVAFPVRKSSNTALENIYLIVNDEQEEINFKPNTTKYEYAVEYQATKCPQVIWEKQEPEQRIDFISRPIGDTTEVKVTAENGDTRTYKIYFKETLAKEANRLNALSVVIDGDEDGEIAFSLKDKTKRTFDVTLPYGARKVEVRYAKLFDEQSVFVQPGGINNPTILTVRSNRPGEADEVYTINPTKTLQNPAILNSIKVDGVDVPGFDPNRFTYIVNRSTKSYPKVVATKNSGVESDPESSMYKWQTTVSKDGASNTYTLFFHYTNEVIPNADFTQWNGTAQNNGGAKPDGWQVPADFFTEVCAISCSKTGAEIVNKGTMDGHEGVVGLETTYQSAAGGALPAIITLGKLSGAMAVANKTHYEFYDFIDFHNTPDAISVNYKHQAHKDNGAFFAYRFKDASNDEYSFDFTDNSTSSSFKTQTQQLTLDGKAIVGMNIAVDATNKDAGASGGAKLYVDWFKLIYNSTPKDAWANGVKADLKNKVFTATITDSEFVERPSYEFKGEVSDQAQLMSWGDWVESSQYDSIKATFINYAEDGTHTDGYSLVVRRPHDTRDQLSGLMIGGTALPSFVPATNEYTIHIPANVNYLPDVYPIPASSRQTVELNWVSDSTLVIAVHPAKGLLNEYTIHFVTDLSDDTELNMVKVGDKVLDTDEMTARATTITAGFMPDITFEKKSDLQKVVVNNGIITVTAENGAVGTYTITRNDTVPTKGDAQLIDFEVNGNILTGFGGDNLNTTVVRPSAILFTRVAEGDSIAFTQTPEKMTWDVTGTAHKLYTLTYADEGSDYAALANITLNGESYGDFNPTTEDYSTLPIVSDSILLVAPKLANSRQTAVVTQTPSATADTLDYTIDVTAESGSATKSYKLRVVRPISNDKTLKAIYADGVLVDGFRSDSTEYTIVLPTPAVKTAQPQMPSITYLAGHKGQTIEFAAGEMGETSPTEIIVTAEDGISNETYTVKVLAEPSHCADLIGIMVNGIAVEEFEPGRHNYSIELNTSDIEVVAASDDRFQTINIIENGYNRTLHVTAEDGVTTADYQVKIYVQAQSNDATLSAILLEQDDQMVELVDFQRALNPMLKFDPMQHSYTINLPAGTTVAPAISARLKMDGQKVDVKKNKMIVTITVTAVDGTTNDYTLNFEVPKSKNADLSMIFLDGDSLPGFTPDYYFYQLNLPVGTHSLPEVVGQKGEARQTLDEVQIDTDKLQATLHVTAEDPTMDNTYIVVFHYTQSDANTLNKVFEDGLAKSTFHADEFYYNDSLPVGTLAFPELSWEEADEWQTVVMDTVLNDANTLIRRIHVTSESGKKNTYLFTHTICKSTADTLQMLYIDTKPLPGFTPLQNEYYYELTAAYANELTDGQLPNVEFLAADTLQKVMITQAKDSLSGKSLGYKTIVSVTAPSGAMRVYTIHYPVETSSDATLNMILLAGKPISNFYSETESYRIDWDARAALPVVTVAKKEEAQTYDILIAGDSIMIDVKAEDKITTMQYAIIFNRQLSDNTLLHNITVAGHREFIFTPAEFAYDINLPYGEDTIPAIEVFLQDTLQTVPEHFTVDTLEGGDIMVLINVKAPNGQDESDYMLTFHFMKNNDALLTGIKLGDAALDNFSSNVMEYEFVHPFGTDSTAFFTAEDVTATLSDSLATYTVSETNNVIYITVTAQDGQTENNYIITQKIGLDDDNYLISIMLNDALIRGFDPENTFYTYMLREGNMPPLVTVEARSENAKIGEVPVVQPGDTCVITVTAENGTKRLYRIHFAVSNIDASVQATEADVLLKRIPGTYTIFAATIRSDIFFVLYDQHGHILYAKDSSLPVANPNDVEVATDPTRSEEERLADVVTTTDNGLILPIRPGEVYMYGFYQGGKKLIKSGKFLAY